MKRVMYVTLVLSLAVNAIRAHAWDGEDIYKITDCVSRTEFRGVGSVPAGQQRAMFDIKGAGKVTYFYLTDASHSGCAVGVDVDLPHFYRGLLFEVYYDGSPAPSISVPVADFFGCFGGWQTRVDSIAIQVNRNSYMCYLPMPFSNGCRIALKNDGPEDRKCYFIMNVDYELGRKYEKEASRLHACWNRSNPVSQPSATVDGKYLKGGKPSSDTPDRAHTILEVTGRGHYVGNFLQCRARHRSWWGEGDTFFIIDGAKQTHSIGTEDEYGACWANGQLPLYQSLYYGHTRNEAGVNRVYRWYYVNPIRFSKSLKVEIQNETWLGTQDDYTSVAFWYQDGAHPVSIAPYSERAAESKATFPKDKSPAATITGLEHPKD